MGLAFSIGTEILAPKTSDKRTVAPGTVHDLPTNFFTATTAPHPLR